MNAPESPAPAASVLPAIAALHVFLAQNPELAALPAWWTVDASDGITVGFRPGACVDADVQSIADALEVETKQYDSVDKDGRWRRMTSARGLLGGCEVFVHGTKPLPLPLPPEDGAE